MCKSDRVQLLSPHALQDLYTGAKQVTVQIVTFKRISEKFFRLKIRNVNFSDQYVCQEDQPMQGVVPGDLVQTREAICISIPALGRKSVKFGPTSLIASKADLDVTNLPSARNLPEEITNHP